MTKSRKPKPKPPEPPPPATVDPHKGRQINFRADVAALVDALDAYAGKIRRSRNQAMNLLLEEALQREGFWPPRSDASE